MFISKKKKKKTISAIKILENIKFENILIHSLDGKNSDFDSNFHKITTMNLLKLSKDLFSALNFIHNQKFSLNGFFKLNDIFYEKFRGKYCLNAEKFFIVNDRNISMDIENLGSLIRKLLQRRISNFPSNNKLN